MKQRRDLDIMLIVSGGAMCVIGLLLILVIAGMFVQKPAPNLPRVQPPKVSSLPLTHGESWHQKIPPKTNGPKVVPLVRVFPKPPAEPAPTKPFTIPVARGWWI